jgi:hypothetical protein
MARCVKLHKLEVKAHADVDPGPITGDEGPADWDNTLKQVTVDITARGDFSGDERKNIESGAKRSPVHYLFGRTGLPRRSSTTNRRADEMKPGRGLTGLLLALSGQRAIHLLKELVAD